MYVMFNEILIMLNINYLKIIKVLKIKYLNFLYF